MQLYLMRHGEALSSHQDARRCLSPQGLVQARDLAAWLGPLGLHVEHVWHSGITRSLQTAELVLPSLVEQPTLIEQPGLAPDAPVEPIVKRIAEHTGDLMIVGHLPFLRDLIGRLIAGRSHGKVVNFTPGSVAALVRDEFDQWSIQWMLTPEIIAHPNRADRGQD